MNTNIRRRHAREAARELLRIHHPELKVTAAAKNATLVAHAKNILGAAASACGSEEVLIKQLIDHLRPEIAASKTSTAPRMYQYDRAMLEAIKRIGNIPRQVVLTSNVKGFQNGQQ